VVEKKTWLEAPIGHQIDGVLALIERINLEVASKIELWKGHSWSFDGTFDVNNEFVCIEINYRPGLNFKGFKWKAD
jgi:hypothetical protein